MPTSGTYLQSQEETSDTDGYEKMALQKIHYINSRNTKK